ncbi:MAG: respiratory nitrate reductase subunit gamma [Nocardioidaceae bacterium]
MTNVGAGGVFLWVALPYLALGIFVLGHIWRWRYDQFGWTSRSTQLQERRWLKWGSPTFHYATFAAIGGHVLGILIPAEFTNFLGIPESVYHYFSAIAGTIAAVLVVAGVTVLAARRLFINRVRSTTSPVDWLALILLLIIILTGIIPTIAVNLVGAGYDYRTTVGVWFRGLFVGQPDVTAMTTAPLLYQVHATAAWVIWAVWPFTRLVHAWSYPLWFLWRPYIVYRSRVAAAPNEPGTGGRKWRKIGSPW